MDLKNHTERLYSSLKEKAVPKGFRMKFHCNITDYQFEDVVNKCSKKLIIRTIGKYKCHIKSLKLEIKNIMHTVSLSFNEHYLSLRKEIIRKELQIERILNKRRKWKYLRDGINFTSEDISNISLLEINRDLSNNVSTKTAKDNLIDNFKIPSYEPIILSKSTLDNTLTSICSKGPSFVPIPSSVNWLQILKDFDIFKHKIRCKAYYLDKVQQPSSNLDSHIQPPFIKKDIKNIAPKSKYPEVETFLSKLEQDIFTNTNRKSVKQNLSSAERKELSSWRNKMKDPEYNTILRIQDKGNRFILVDKEIDIEKSSVQIQRSNFITINEDPTNKHIEKVKSFVKKWSGLNQLTTAWQQFIINENAQPGKNSPLYKTHKPDIPVRLLTTGCNTAIENLAIFVEKHCAPLTDKIETRIKDSYHLLDIIDDLNQQSIPDNAILVSFDIINMFPSIDNERGLIAVKSALENRIIKEPSTDCIIEALRLCLFNNNSTFAGQNWLQTNGTAMGAANSCSYSDLAIYPIDKRILNEKVHNFTELHTFYRYRDDCFTVWLGSIDRLNNFLDFINGLDPHLKFTMEIGYKELCFLDLKMSLQQNKISTSVYSKPTDSHLYLHGSSCHAGKSIDGISMGVATRLRRICSSDAVFHEQAREYKAFLAARDNNPRVINNSFDKISKQSRQQMRKKQKKVNMDITPTIFTTHYNPLGPDFKSIISKHLPLLCESNTLKDAFPRESIFVAFKRFPNLKELMVRADPYSREVDHSQDPNPGYVRCNKRSCDSCDNFVDIVSSFKCNATGKTFKIRRSLSCSTQYVVYMAYCTKCKQQGAGSTNNWKPRLANYKSHIKKGIKTCSIAKHFIESCCDNEEPFKYLRFVILDRVNNYIEKSSEEIEKIMLEKEKFWIGVD